MCRAVIPVINMFWQKTTRQCHLPRGLLSALFPCYRLQALTDLWAVDKTGDVAGFVGASEPYSSHG